MCSKQVAILLLGLTTITAANYPYFLASDEYWTATVYSNYGCTGNFSTSVTLSIGCSEGDQNGTYYTPSNCSGGTLSVANCTDSQCTSCSSPGSFGPGNCIFGVSLVCGIPSNSKTACKKVIQSSMFMRLCSSVNTKPDRCWNGIYRE